MAVSSGWARKSAIFLPSVLVILVIAGEGTQRFSIQNTAGLLAPFWFRHFAWLPQQRFWEFVEALRKLGHVIGYGLACAAFFATALLVAQPAFLPLFCDRRLGVEEPRGRMGADSDHAAGLRR